MTPSFCPSQSKRLLYGNIAGGEGRNRTVQVCLCKPLLAVSLKSVASRNDLPRIALPHQRCRFICGPLDFGKCGDVSPLLCKARKRRLRVLKRAEHYLPILCLGFIATRACLRYRR